MDQLKYSFVIPCYRSENTIGRVVEEIHETAAREQIEEYEIILVNDCSPDNVWEKILSLTESDRRVKGICLSRNFGQHAALLAGYSHVTGDVIVSVDDDGQAPLDELGKLIAEMDKGFDVVYSYNNDQEKRSLFRKFGTYMSTQMCRWFLDAPKDFKGNSFYIMRRFVADEMVKYDNAYPFLAGLILRTTKKIGYVCTGFRERMSGSSGYSFRKLFSLWLNGFTAFSVKPLEVGAWVGALFAAFGFIGGIVTIINKLVNPDVLMGWSSMFCLLLFVGGVILIMLGLIGEYIGRIYICINKSPQYVIRTEAGFDREYCEQEQV